MALLFGNAEESRYGLAGLKSVRVVAGNLSPVLNGTGVTAEGVKTRVESLLRQSGCVSVGESAAAYFFVGLLGVGEMPDGDLVYNVELILSQPALLLRTRADPATENIRTLLLPAAVTWRGVCISVVSRSEVKAAVEDSLAEHVKAFAEDYANENPGTR